MDGFWEASLKPWDTRAAALILEEAGGRVTGMDGKAWDPGRRATSSPPTASFTTRCLRILVSRALGLSLPRPVKPASPTSSVQRDVAALADAIVSGEESRPRLLLLVQHVAAFGGFLDQHPARKRATGSK